MTPITRSIMAVMSALSGIPIHPCSIFQPPVKAGEILVVAIIVWAIPPIGADLAVVHRRSRRGARHAACQHEAEAHYNDGVND